MLCVRQVWLERKPPVLDYLRSVAIAGQRLRALWSAPVRSLPVRACVVKKKKKKIRAVFVVQCETTGGFLLVLRLRATPSLVGDSETPPYDCGSRSRGARLFARVIVVGSVRVRPVNQLPPNLTISSGDGAPCAVVVSPPPNLAPPSLGQGGRYGTM